MSLRDPPQAENPASQDSILIYVALRHTSRCGKIDLTQKFQERNQNVMEEKKELEEIIFEQETQPEQTEEIASAEPAAEDVQETMEDYADELEASFRTFSVGDVLTGTVIDVDESGVLMDFNYYAPGRIPAEEMSADPHFQLLEEVHVGDAISATVVRLDDGAGNLLLSRKEADDVLAWDKLKQMQEDHTVITGTITEVVPAGAILYVEGVRGFIPASKLALTYVEDTSVYLNQTVRVQVLDVQEEEKKLVLSAKELLTEQAMEERAERAGRMQEGTVLEGTVEKLMPYGAFVQIGDGVSGLLHVSEISEKRIKHPKVVLSEGQKVRVKITRVENGKISLSMKALNDVLNKEDEPVFDYKEEGEAATSLGALLAGFKLK